MNKPNYQKELERTLDKIAKQKAAGQEAPTLFLHSCCAPCSSYVLRYLREYFRITVFYYNPNISEEAEYRKRVEEQKKLIALYNEQVETRACGYPIETITGDYEREAFFKLAAPYKDCPEGGERCFLCYEMRLRKTAVKAKEEGFDYFATTLTISPLKNAEKLNEIGYRLSGELGITWLPSDFKKKDGYKQSIALSAEYGLYRQDYCGCVYSYLERHKGEKQP